MKGLPLFHRRHARSPGPNEGGGTTTKEEEDGNDGNVSAQTTTMHVQALDAILKVNSFFTGAAFIGVSAVSPSLPLSLVPECPVGSNSPKLILVHEVLAFSCYLLSTLIAQGLKLLLVAGSNKPTNNNGGGGNKTNSNGGGGNKTNSNGGNIGANMMNTDDTKDSSMTATCRIDQRVLRLGMLGTVAGTVLGSVSLLLSIVQLVEVRLGGIATCDSSWSRWAAIPLVVLVATGLFSFISTFLFAFLKK